MLYGPNGQVVSSDTYRPPLVTPTWRESGRAFPQFRRTWGDRARRLKLRCGVSNAWWARLLREELGAAGDVKNAYAASSQLTQTNLDGITSSSTWVAGWESGAIDNSSNLYLDYRVYAELQVESTGLSAGQIRVYYVREKNDSAYPDVFDGTESTETVTDTEIRDAICRLAGFTDTDTTASRVYPIDCLTPRQVFGVCPRKFVIFITQSTGTTLETTGDPNNVWVAGVYENVAAS